MTEGLGSLEIVLVVAVADNGVIGRDNALPWRLPSDLKRFKTMTLNKPVVMGRKTYQSIGRPLPGRTNIVISGDPALRLAGAVVARSHEDAMAIAAADARRRGTGEIAVIGGARVFDQSLPLAHRVELTEVHAAPYGDTRWTPLPTGAWVEAARERHRAGEGDSADFSYVTLRRRPS